MPAGRRIAAHSSPVMVRVEGALAYLDTVGTTAADEVYKRMLLKLTSACGTLHRELHQRGHFHEHSPVSDHDEHHG